MYLYTNLVIGGNGVLEITNPIMDTGCIKSIISSMMKSIEFLIPHTGLPIVNNVCIVIYMYSFSSRNVNCIIIYMYLFSSRNVNCKPEMTIPKESVKSRDLGRFLNIKYGRNGRTRKCPITGFDAFTGLQLSC